MEESTYLTFFIFGVVTAVTEWNRICTTTAKKILSCFTFPLFMATYLPISVTALFQKVEWKPIKHNVTKSIDDMDEEQRKK